jgi:hypothetical protein
MSDPRRDTPPPSIGQFLLVYFSLLAVVALVTLLSMRVLHIEPMRGAFLTLGIAFLLCAANRPRLAFAVLRRVRGMLLVRDDTTARVLFAILGAIAIALAFLLSDATLASLN